MTSVNGGRASVGYALLCYTTTMPHISGRTSGFESYLYFPGHKFLSNNNVMTPRSLKWEGEKYMQLKKERSF